MAKKMYDIEYGPTWWECTVVIDHTPETENAMRAMVEFWTGYENRIESNDGDITKTFLQQLGSEINYIQAEYHCGLAGVLKEFETGREGWCKMDGSMGIEIVSVDDFEFAHDQYQVGEGLPVDEPEISE